MPEILGVLVTQNGPEVRFNFDADARDAWQSAGVNDDDIECTHYFWTDGMKRKLTTEWAGATDVQLDSDGWGLSFRLRPAVTLNDALKAFVAVYTAQCPSYKALVVHR